MEVLPNSEKLNEPAGSCAAPFEHVVYLNQDTIAFVDEIDGDAGADIETQLSEVYALEVYHEEIRREEQIVLDEAFAMSFYAEEEHKLLDVRLETESEKDDALVMAEVSDVQDAESMPPPICSCCATPLEDKRTRRILTCSHLYCISCITTCCRMGVADRSMVPAHCCKREFPLDYVREVLTEDELAIYERFLKDKAWCTLDLESDREYARVVEQNHGVQCPGCGIGVQRSTGCNHMMCLNHHEFCFRCGGKWKTCSCSY